jgi:hypothetical protein
VFFNLAVSEGLQLYSRIGNLTISNGTVQCNISQRFSWLKGLFFGGDYWDILQKEVKTYPMAQV